MTNAFYQRVRSDLCGFRPAPSKGGARAASSGYCPRTPYLAANCIQNSCALQLVAQLSQVLHKTGGSLTVRNRYAHPFSFSLRRFDRMYYLAVCLVCVLSYPVGPVAPNSKFAPVRGRISTCLKSVLPLNVCVNILKSMDACWFMCVCVCQGRGNRSC